MAPYHMIPKPVAHEHPDFMRKLKKVCMESPDLCDSRLVQVPEVHQDKRVHFIASLTDPTEEKLKESVALADKLQEVKRKFFFSRRFQVNP